MEQTCAIRGRPQQFLQLLDWYRWAHQVALHLIAAMPAQELRLLESLDALGNHLELQFARESDDGGADRTAVALGIQILDERTVDLQRIDRETAQIAQGRIAGTEVIDLQRQACGAEALHAGCRVIHVAQQ